MMGLVLALACTACVPTARSAPQLHMQAQHAPSPRPVSSMQPSTSTPQPSTVTPTMDPTILPQAQITPSPHGAPSVPPVPGGPSAPRGEAGAAAQTLDLAVALQEADQRNPEVIAATQAVDIARAVVLQAAQPPLQAQSGPGLTSDVPLGLGQLQTFSVGASQQFSPTVGAARSVASSGVQIALGQYNATRRDVEQRVVTAYYGLGSAQAVVTAAQQNLTNARQLERTARERVRVGDVGSFEVLRATVERRRAETAVATAQASERTSRIGLNALLGRNLAQPMSVALPTTSSQPSDIDVLFTQAQRVDPQVAQLRATIAQSAAQERVARSQRAPSVGVGAGYLFQRALGSSGTANRGAASSGLTAALTLSLPVLDNGTIRGAVREAQARQTVARSQLRGRSAQLRAELASDVTVIASAQERLTFSRTSLAQARDALRLAQFGYTRGALGVLDVLSARNELAAAQADETQAAADLGAAVARLRLTIGAPITP